MSESSTSTSIPYFPVKDPNEDLAFGIDMTAQMTEDEDTISSILSVVASPMFVPQGVTAAAPSLTAQGLSGNVMTVVVSGGTVYVNYRLSFRFQTAKGSIYQRSGILPINYR